MRLTRVTVLVAAPILVVSIAAAREVTRSASFPTSAATATQDATPAWFLIATGDRLEARQVNSVATSAVPYEQVTLRRTLGGVVVSCGNFGNPTLTDNAVSRVWTYTTPRPRTGICASVAGARFSAVGRKNGQETSTPAVP